MALEIPSYVAGQPVRTDDLLAVHYPWDGSLTGVVDRIQVPHLQQAIDAALSGASTRLNRYERHLILRRAAAALEERRDEFAELIRLESGLCARETRYETGRSSDVLEFAAIEALRDDGQIFSGDVSPQGKPRKIFTFRQPVRLMSAITPFNHPLNQVVHKLAPAIAAGVPVLLKPSDKAPLTALRFVELLYEVGLPGWMLSAFVGDLDDVVHEMIVDERVELVSFTGSVAVGHAIARKAGYKKLCLELGGNSPLIVLDDADLDLAARLAAEGSFRNSGQRCTAVKRLLVQRSVVEAFTERFVEVAREYVAGDPADPGTRVGTVIDQATAETLERRVEIAVAEGARLLLGGRRHGALMEPTVITDVGRDTEMVACESFGPLAPIIPVDDIGDAIDYYNRGPFGLSSAIVTRSLDSALRAVQQLRCGTTNVNEVPGYRIESSPFGGIKDSGLGIKEGVIEAMKYMTNIKTFSLPWEDGPTG
jgi:putative phosphonoacetaldehyde dehydrogenase